jgi:hypothetical protein
MQQWICGGVCISMHIGSVWKVGCSHALTSLLSTLTAFQSYVMCTAPKCRCSWPYLCFACTGVLLCSACNEWKNKFLTLGPRHCTGCLWGNGWHSHGSDATWRVWDWSKCSYHSPSSVTSRYALQPLNILVDVIVFYLDITPFLNVVRYVNCDLTTGQPSSYKMQGTGNC